MQVKRRSLPLRSVATPMSMRLSLPATMCLQAASGFRGSPSVRIQAVDDLVYRPVAPGGDYEAGPGPGCQFGGVLRTLGRPDFNVEAAGA